MTGHLAALGAALAWTLASGLWRSLSSRGSALALNAAKNGIACLIFLPVLVSLPWQDNRSAVGLLLLSGVVGIAAGDSFYLASLRRLGTRRTLTVEALGPVLATLGSVVLMGESLEGSAWIGAAMVTAAVVLVAGPSDAISRDGAGLALAFLAVISGLAGAFLAREVLISSTLTPLQTASVRLCGGWAGLLPLLRWKGEAMRHWISPFGVRMVIATVLGTNLGIALQQFVFQQMPVGPGVTLMGTAPVMALVIGRFEGDPIQPRGIAAALLAVSGVALTRTTAL